MDVEAERNSYLFVGRFDRVNRAEMEPDSRVHQVHRDHQDK